MRKSVVSLMVFGLMAAVAQDADAQGQTWADRGYLNIGFGVESGYSALTDTKTSTIYDETATISSASTFTSGSLLDVGVGLRLWRNFTAGVSYHQEKNIADGLITGAIPSPMFFNRPRTLTHTAAGLTRKEQATHVQFGWVIPIGSRLDVLVSTGPSFFRLQQDVVSDVTIGESGAPFTAVLAQPTVVTRKQSVVGYNVGADVTYIVWKNDSVRVGAGFFIRQTQATGTVKLFSAEPESTIGGLQVGFGGRIRF